MTWQALTSRTLNIRWAQRLSDARIDPYLVWADATRFAGFSTKPPERIAIAFEVNLNAGAVALAAFGKVFTSPQVGGDAAAVGTRFGVASLSTSALAWLLEPSVQQLVPRFEIGMPLSGTAYGLSDGLLNLQALEFDLGTKGAPVAAVIDDGCPFAHAAFRTRKGKRWQTRIAALWFQEDRKFGFSGAQLNKYINRSTRLGVVDERACYTELRDELRKRLTPSLADAWWQRTLGPATHGAHVLDVFAGSPNPLAERYRVGSIDDHAEQARIMFVQLPRGSIDDTSGLSMNVCVLEALVYLAARVQGRSTVVNLSYGSLAGPHDGSSLLESAMDHFLDEHRNFSIVIPAGNGYDYLTHASVVAGPDARWHDMPLRILPDDPTDTFVELWYEPQLAGDARAILDIQLIAPDGSCSDAVPCDTALEFVRVVRGKETPIAAVVHQSRPPTAPESSKHSVLVALAASRPTLRNRPAAAHGVWTVRVRNRGGLAVTVNAWIERDDSAFGSGRSRTQAVFLSRGVEPAPGDPHSATAPIDRRVCLNSIAHGDRTIVVGGSVLQPQQLAHYSASGPGRRGAWPGPNYVAPCEESPGIGLQAAGTRSGSLVHMNGTSAAAPIAARDILNRAFLGCTRAPPDIDPDALKPPSEAEAGHAMPDPQLRRGAGLLRPLTTAAAGGRPPMPSARNGRARRG
jgi:hypothetical protein